MILVSLEFHYKVLSKLSLQQVHQKMDKNLQVSIMRKNGWLGMKINAIRFSTIILLIISLDLDWAKFGLKKKEILNKLKDFFKVRKLLSQIS